MNLALASILLFASLGKPDIYPAKVTLIEAHSDRIGRGNGHGNVFDPKLGIRGFDYVYAGCGRIQPTRGGDVYQARWASPQRLIIETQPIGSTSTGECILRVTLHNYTFAESRDGQLRTVPLGANNGGKNAAQQ